VPNVETLTVFNTEHIMSDSFLNRSLLLAGAVFLAAPLGACNTVEGAGQDIESVGGAVSHTANEAGEEMGEAADEAGDEIDDEVD
jgi:predicted small secreted protein